jgi:hypothetical protein
MDEFPSNRIAIYEVSLGWANDHATLELKWKYTPLRGTLVK